MGIQATNAGNAIAEIGSFITLAKPLDTLFGFKLLDGAELAVSGNATGYTGPDTKEVVPSGGTYSGDAKFSITLSGGGVVDIIEVIGGSTAESASLVGETVIFDEATLQASFGAGTGGATGTIAAVDETEITEVALGGNPNNGMGLYVGGAGDVEVRLKGMKDYVLFKGITACEFLPILATSIRKTGAAKSTTATDLMAFI
jgi:hypothetical protein